MDCVEGARAHVEDGLVNLLICDPPFGINDSTFDKHYYRNTERVIEGYEEAPKEFTQYKEFTYAWFEQAKRVLHPTGTLYVFSGWNNLEAILSSGRELGMDLLGNLIWKFNFGCYNQFWINTHYHILPFCHKKQKKHITFNRNCRYGDTEIDENDRKLCYGDREDVFLINKDYKPGSVKNQNKLPDELMRKLILYSSNENDMVGDFFLGSFVSAIQAKKLGRRALGFELNKNAFDAFLPLYEKAEFGEDLASLREPNLWVPEESGKPLTPELIEAIQNSFTALVKDKKKTKKEAREILMQEFQRGYWSIDRILKRKMYE